MSLFAVLFADFIFDLVGWLLLCTFCYVTVLVSLFTVKLHYMCCCPSFPSQAAAVRSVVTAAVAAADIVVPALPLSYGTLARDVVLGTVPQSSEVPTRG